MPKDTGLIDPELTDAEAAMLWTLAGYDESRIELSWGYKLGFGGGDLGAGNFGAELGIRPSGFLRANRPTKIRRYKRGLVVQVLRAGAVALKGRLPMLGR